MSYRGECAELAEALGVVLAGDCCGSCLNDLNDGYDAAEAYGDLDEIAGFGRDDFWTICCRHTPERLRAAALAEIPPAV